MFIASIAKQKVGGLDVPVDDVGSMQRLSCFDNLFGDVNLVGYLKRIPDVIDILMQGMIVPVHIDQVVLEKILDEIGLIIYLPDDLELVLYFQQVSDVLIFAILLEGFLYKSYIQFLLGLGVYYAVLSVLDIKVSAFVFLLIYQPIVSPQLIFRILSHLKNTVLFSRVPLHHLRRLCLHQFTLSQQNICDFILQLLFFRQNLAHEQVLMVHWPSYDNQQLNNVFFALQDFFLQLLIDFLGFLSALDAHCLINILQRLNALVNHEHYRCRAIYSPAIEAFFDYVLMAAMYSDCLSIIVNELTSANSYIAAIIQSYGMVKLVGRGQIDEQTLPYFSYVLQSQFFPMLTYNCIL